MSNNNTPPKETQVTESFPFIIYKGCIYSYNSEVPEGATVLNAPNIDTAMGYLSEESVNEMLEALEDTIIQNNKDARFREERLETMLAEKDKEIERLKFMIDNNLTEEDMTNDNKPPQEI